MEPQLASDLDTRKLLYRLRRNKKPTFNQTLSLRAVVLPVQTINLADLLWWTYLTSNPQFPKLQLLTLFFDWSNMKHCLWFCTLTSIKRADALLELLTPSATRLREKKIKKDQCSKTSWRGKFGGRNFHQNVSGEPKKKFLVDFINDLTCEK